MPTLDLSPDELLTTTRSVRKRLDLDRDVPLDLVRECIEIALQAPSGSNRQGWHWLVVTDPTLRAEIGEYYERATTAYLGSGTSAHALFADDPKRAAIQRRIGTSVEYLAAHMRDVPVQLIACIKAGELEADNQAGLWGSILPAAWSFMLAARARGLGTAWTTLHLEYEAEVAQLLGLPAGIRQGVLIPTAYYTGDSFRPAARTELDDVVHLNGW